MTEQPKFVQAADWRDIGSATWPWRNFTPFEMRCPASGNVLVNVEFMDKLQALRERLGKPMIVTSGYRSAKYNTMIDGAVHSRHMYGEAADIAMVNHNPQLVFNEARKLGFLGFGFYPSMYFMHLDLGSPQFLDGHGKRVFRHWGDPRPWGITPA